MLQELHGQVAWITGAGSGIGAAAAEALAGAGVTVVLSGRRADRLEQVADKIQASGGVSVMEPLDVTDRIKLHSVVHRIKNHLGRIDILVNNAGINLRERSWNDVQTEAWDQILNVNLNGAFYCCQAVLPVMREQGGGLIVNMSSWAGRYVSRVAGPAYTAAKHAMTAMNESINMEQCRYGIRACCIGPGEVATDFLDHRPEPVAEEDRVRMVQPEDVAELILFVARMPERVCLNDILISPTWNRGYLGIQTDD